MAGSGCFASLLLKNFREAVPFVVTASFTLATIGSFMISPVALFASFQCYRVVKTADEMESLEKLNRAI